MSSVWHFSHSFLQLLSPIFSTCENVQGIQVSLGSTRSISGCLVYVWFTSFTAPLLPNEKKKPRKTLWGDTLSRFALWHTGETDRTKLTMKRGCQVSLASAFTTSRPESCVFKTSILSTVTSRNFLCTCVMFLYFFPENYSFNYHYTNCDHHTDH